MTTTETIPTTDEGDDGDLCRTCNKSRLWHREEQPRHLFRGWDEEPQRLGAGKARGPASAMAMPFDPVLRLILMNRGLITQQEIEDATKQLAALVPEIAHKTVTYRGGVDSDSTRK